jgi:hypothetical protein
LGAGVVLPPQRRTRPSPYTGKVLRERAASGTTGCLLPRTRSGWTRSWPR